MAIPKIIQDDAPIFFDRVFKLSTEKEVALACNELLDGFVDPNRKPTPLKSKTISTYLSEYRKYFRGKAHENPELNKPIKGEDGQQHCAHDRLDLTPEQLAEVLQANTLSSQKKKGFDENGELRDISNIPKKDITEIIKMSLECLTSEKPTVIACGILNLTGLRISEQAMPRHQYKDVGIVEHTMIAVSKYEIAFRGVVKKRTFEETTAFYKRPTLVPAQMIVDAQQKYLQSTKVQAISTDIDTFQGTFYQNIKNEYKRRFSKVLSTIEVYEDGGDFLEGKEDGNGKPHLARSFYACVLRAVLRLNGFGNSAIDEVVQLSLVHRSETETRKYLGTFDESLLINPPNYINVSTNLKEYGIMPNPPIIPVKEVVKSFDIDKFTDGLEIEENLKLIEFLRSGMSETQAILELFKIVRNQKSATKTAEKTDTSEVKEKPRSVSVKEIVEGIMHYNRQATDGDIKKIVVPSNGIINEIAKLRHHGKTIAPLTIKNHFIEFNDVLDEELKDLGIVEGMGGSHNNIHRGKLGELAAKIMEYIEPG
ncbi:protelomerase family protein [Microcoleus sp. D3_18a_C4]